MSHTTDGDIPFAPTPTPKKSGMTLLLLVMFGGLAAAPVFCCAGMFFNSAPAIARKPGQEQRPKIPKEYASDEDQSKRRKAIEIYVRAGLIVKEETAGDTPHIYVAPTIWKSMLFDDKERLAAVLSAWNYKTKRITPKGTFNVDEMVVFHDGTTSQRIAKYTPLAGLELNK